MERLRRLQEGAQREGCGQVEGGLCSCLTSILLERLPPRPTILWTPSSLPLLACPLSGCADFLSLCVDLHSSEVPSAPMASTALFVPVLQNPKHVE